MVKQKYNPKCPICTQNYYDVESASEICKRHFTATWIVTTCRDCKNSCISQYPGLCMNCFENSPKMDRGAGKVGFSTDHRASLRNYGLDSDNDYFGDHE